MVMFYFVFSIYLSTPIKSGQESLFPDANWANVVSLYQTRGLSPKQRSWLFEWTRNLYASNERLHRLGKVETPQCSFCDQTDNCWHMIYCKHNEIITSNLKKIIGKVCEETVPQNWPWSISTPQNCIALPCCSSSLNPL